MPYSITNKMLKFLLFASLSVLFSCSSINLTPPKVTEPNGNKPVSLKQHSESVALTAEPNIAQIEPKLTVKETLWQRLFALYQFPAVDNERIQAQINWYLKHPSYLARVQKNAEPYLYFIVNEIEQRQIPGELALLPVVESAFKPFAYSHGRAAGLWQFIPSTGRAFGLQQTWWYDGRRDVYRSTHAALSYLTKLSKRFDDDWLLALAGYNAGGGTVSSAIRRNKRLGKNHDYWALTLRQETENYVPKLIAIATILANAEKYKVPLRDIPNAPFFSRVDITKQLDLARAAELAEISIEQLYELNPAFNQWATSPHGPHYLLIPQQHAESFSLKLATLADSQRLKWIRHQVKAGETLGHISRRYHTTSQQIMLANKLTNNTIRAGKHLLIPTASYNNTLYSNSEEMRKKAIINRSQRGHKLEYFVQAGDSFWSIAKQHKVSVRQLAQWNAMAPGDTLALRQKLIIWSKHASSKSLLTHSNKNQTIRYTVRNGDSLYLISKKFKVSVRDLRQWNLLQKKYLKPGQTLKIVVDVTRS